MCLIAKQSLHGEDIGGGKFEAWVKGEVQGGVLQFWYWYWYWYCVGMVLVWYCHLYGTAIDMVLLLVWYWYGIVWKI